LGSGLAKRLRCQFQIRVDHLSAFRQCFNSRLVIRDDASSYLRKYAIYFSSGLGGGGYHPFERRGPAVTRSNKASTARALARAGEAGSWQRLTAQDAKPISPN